MPRTNPLKFEMDALDKAFMYRTLKKLSTIALTSPVSRQSQKDITRLATKFPPGKSFVYLQPWERQVILRWLLKLYNLAAVRKETTLENRFKKIIDILK